MLAGLLAAALATNTPMAVSNLVAQETGLSISVPNPNDPVEREYQALIDKDDTTMRQIEAWTDPGGTTNEVTRLTLKQRVKAAEDDVRLAYDDFLRRHPNHARAHLAFGAFLDEIQDEDGAFEQWKKGLELDPKNPAAWDDLGNYFGHAGPITNAFIYYQKAIDLDPTQSVYYHNLAVTIYMYRQDAEQFYHLSEQDAFDKALALYREAIKRAPDDFILASDYAECFYGTNPPRWEQGLVAWQDALKSAHDDTEREGVYIHLARINWKLNRYDESQHWLDQVTNKGYAVLKNRIARNLHEAETNHPDIR